MIDFTLDKRLQQLREKIRQFVDTVVIPEEGNLSHDLGKLEALRAELQGKAKRERTSSSLTCPRSLEVWGSTGGKLR